MAKKLSQTTVIEKNGHKVSITPNQIKSGGNSYRVYRVRATILGERVTQTARTLEDAEKKANALLAQIKAKGGVVATYTPQQVAVIESALDTCTKARVTLTQAVTGYAEAAKYLPEGVSLVEAARGYAAKLAKETIVPITVTKLVEKYKESIKGTSEVHQKTIGPRLDRAANHFRCNISDITAGHVDEWLNGLEVGPLTRNHHRVALSSLMRFAQVHDHLEDGLTAADKVKPAKKHEKAIEAYTPAEAYFILQNIETRWRPYAALGLFAGIRPQETLNLDWSDIKKDHIEVRASGSKVGVRRIVPLLPALSAWITPFRLDSGPVCPVFKGGDTSRQQSISKAMREVVAAAVEKAQDPTATKSQKELGSMRVIFDGLRHSFISYRLAIVKDFPQVAMEAGNSVEIIQRHYNKRATEAEAKTFFALSSKAPKNIISIAA
jgi:integrase